MRTALYRESSLYQPGAALVLPRCNNAAMRLHLAEIAACVAPGAHAVLLLDQAGWHRSDKLVVPANPTLLPLPPNARNLHGEAPVKGNFLRCHDSRFGDCVRSEV